MKSRIVFSLLILLLFLYPVIRFTQAQCKTGKNCCGAASFADCADQGCGGDPLLNGKKNRTDNPAASAVNLFTILEIANFTHPASWSSGQPRTLLETWGEGRGLQVMLYIKAAKNYPSGAESCNCNLKGNDNNDFHIVLVTRKNDPEEKSLTAEISPRLRPAGWDIQKLRALATQKTFVRVTGWAMLDTQHVGKSTPKRKTHWEIHPVTSFEVCTATVTQCRQGEGWEDLATFEP